MEHKYGCSKAITMWIALYMGLQQCTTMELHCLYGASAHNQGPSCSQVIALVLL